MLSSIVNTNQQELVFRLFFLVLVIPFGFALLPILLMVVYAGCVCVDAKSLFRQCNASERNLLESGMVKPKIAFLVKYQTVCISLSLGHLSGTGRKIY